MSSGFCYAALGINDVVGQRVRFFQGIVAATGIFGEAPQERAILFRIVELQGTFGALEPRGAAANLLLRSAPRNSFYRERPGAAGFPAADESTFLSRRPLHWH